MSLILYTGHDGRVAICAPSQNCIRWMATGGRWSDMPRGFVDTQIERQIAGGHLPDAAARFARALAFGGLTESEALCVIKDRDCGHLGTAHDVVDASDLPDRWFRDAWRRSHNGGPISINIDAARGIQFKRLRKAVDTENKRRSDDLYAYVDPIIPDWGVIAGRIKKANDVDDLRRVWIEGIGGKQ